MSRYRKVDLKVWGDARVRRLSRPPPNGRDCWLYLLAAKESTALPGVITAGAAAMAETLRWPLPGFLRSFAEVEAQEMAKADWDACLVWVPNAVKYNPPANPNVVKSWAKVWDELPDSPLKGEILEQLASVIGGMSAAFVEAFKEGFRKAFPKGFPEGFSKTLERVPPTIPETGAGAGAGAGSSKNLAPAPPPPAGEGSPDSHAPSPALAMCDEVVTDASPEPPPADRRKPDSIGTPIRARNPVWRPLVDQLGAAFLEARGSPYDFQAKDGVALKHLLQLAEPEEIRSRWRYALGAKGWLACATVAQLRSRWNELAGKGVQEQQRPPCARCGGDAPGGETWGHALCYPCFGAYTREIERVDGQVGDYAAFTREWVTRPGPELRAVGA
jgi:hypothetical protein